MNRIEAILDAIRLRLEARRAELDSPELVTLTIDMKFSAGQVQPREIGENVGMERRRHPRHQIAIGNHM